MVSGSGDPVDTSNRTVRQYICTAECAVWQGAGFKGVLAVAQVVAQVEEEEVAKELGWWLCCS